MVRNVICGPLLPDCLDGSPVVLKAPWFEGAAVVGAVVPRVPPLNVAVLIAAAPDATVPSVCGVFMFLVDRGRVVAMLKRVSSDGGRCVGAGVHSCLGGRVDESGSPLVDYRRPVMMPRTGVVGIDGTVVDGIAPVGRFMSSRAVGDGTFEFTPQRLLTSRNLGLNRRQRHRSVVWDLVAIQGRREGPRVSADRSSLRRRRKRRRVVLRYGRDRLGIWA